MFHYLRLFLLTRSSILFFFLSLNHSLFQREVQQPPATGLDMVWQLITGAWWIKSLWRRKATQEGSFPGRSPCAFSLTLPSLLPPLKVLQWKSCLCHVVSFLLISKPERKCLPSSPRALDYFLLPLGVRLVIVTSFLHECLSLGILSPHIQPGVIDFPPRADTDLWHLHFAWFLNPTHRTGLRPGGFSQNRSFPSPMMVGSKWLFHTRMCPNIICSDVPQLSPKLFWCPSKVGLVQVLAVLKTEIISTQNWGCSG